MKPVIEVSELDLLLKDGKVKLIDASFTSYPELSNWEQFQKTSFGCFDELIKRYPEKDYEEEHIDGAVNFSLNIGLFAGQYKRHDLYPPSIFENYLRKLGIDTEDHVVVYGRGAGAGMLFAAHVWWVLQYYGLEKVQVLNGGIEAWKNSGRITNKGQIHPKEGNFKAKNAPALAVSFEELQEILDNDKLRENVNLLDCRPKEQYSDQVCHLFPLKENVTGCHIKDSKSFPALDLVCGNGFRPENEIRKILEACGYLDGKPTITFCGVGNQGSLALLALQFIGISNAKLYQGGMAEVVRRKPSSLE